jgi:hypothetical protein
MQAQIFSSRGVSGAGMGLPIPNKCEARMQIKEKENIRATLSIRVVEAKLTGEHEFFHPQHNGAEASAELYGRLFEFAGNAPATFAERFPRLMVTAVAFALIVAAIAVEIEYLRSAGYYWP